MGTHPIFESDFDCLTERKKREKTNVETRARIEFEPGQLGCGRGTGGRAGHVEQSRRVNAQEPCHYARQETRWWCWRSEAIGLWRSQRKVDGAASDVGRVFFYHRQE